MILIVDSERFDIREACELHRYAEFVGNANHLGNGTLRVRSPLVVRLFDKLNARILHHGQPSRPGGRDATAAAGTTPAFMGRRSGDSGAGCRGLQLRLRFADDEGHAAFQVFLEDDLFHWVRPAPLVDSNWADVDASLPLDERTDQFPGSILDFVFVTGAAKGWSPVSRVVVRDGDFPDTADTSDHRPVDCVLAP